MNALTRHLAADAFVRGAVIVTAALGLLYTLSAFATEHWLAIKFYLVEPPLVVLTIAAIVARVRHVERLEERRFWGFLAAAHVFYLFAFVYLGETLEERWLTSLILFEDVLILLYYAGMVLAIGASPHLRRRSAASGTRSRIGSAGSLTFFFGLLVYFILIPGAFSPDSTKHYVPAIFLYVTLDTSILIAFLSIRRAASPRWRRVYGLLAITSAVWMVLDLIDGLLFLELIPESAPGALTDLAWILPFLPVIVAARTRREGADGIGTDAPLGAPEALRQQSTTGVSLIVYLAAIPTMHFGLHWADLLEVGNQTYREICVLVLLLLLGVFALLDLRFQREEQRQFERQLRQVQKMESLGTLAGGIAHSFNNLLTVIIGQAQLFHLDLKPGDRARERMEEILAAGVRAKELVEQILAFSRKGEDRPETVELTGVLREVLKIVQASIPPTVELRARVDERERHVLADRTQLHSAAINLCTNALDAMRESGGTLSLSIDPAQGTDPAPAGLGLSPGSYYRVRVSDTGQGMTHDVAERVFDPFFTTKPPGKGTGLGMALVYGIVAEAGGAVAVDSEPGVGTTVDVYLPQASPAIAARAALRPPAGVGRGVVMVVDDESENAAVLKRMLEWLGYDAVSFSSPLEALESFRRRPAAYDLVITDHSMPGMSGDALAAAITRDRTDLPVLLCTGFGEGVERDLAGHAGVCDVLGKPILLEDLSAAVEDAIRAAPKDPTRG